jgi:isopentenyl-diphosphate delta-isomerase
MGFKAELKELFILYKAPFDNGLTEHELDHVMIGYYNEDPVINPEEVKIGSGWESTLLKLMISFPKSIQFGSGLFFDEFYHFLEDHKI